MRCFALPVHEDRYPISAVIDGHADKLPDDELTILVINHRWRRLLGNLASILLQRWVWTGTDPEIDDAIQKAHLLIYDLYTMDARLEVEQVRVKVGSTSDEAIPAADATFLTFEDPDTMGDCYDDFGFWNAAQPDRLIVPAGQAGWYRIIANLRWSNAAIGLYWTTVQTQNTGLIAMESRFIAGGLAMSCLNDVYLQEGEYVALSVFTTTARSTDARTNYSPRLAMYKLTGKLVPTS